MFPHSTFVIIIMQIYLMTLRINNACHVFSVECVSKMKSILSLYYRGLCFRLTHFSCDDFDNMCTLSYFHPQIGSMNNEPLFRIRSLNNDMRSMSCYILPVLIYQRQGYIALMSENHPEKIWRYQSESDIELCILKSHPHISWGPTLFTKEAIHLMHPHY